MRSKQEQNTSRSGVPVQWAAACPLPVILTLRGHKQYNEETALAWALCSFFTMPFSCITLGAAPSPTPHLPLSPLACGKPALSLSATAQILNLHPDIGDEDLKELFLPFGEINYVRVVSGTDCVSTPQHVTCMCKLNEQHSKDQPVMHHSAARTQARLFGMDALLGGQHHAGISQLCYTQHLTQHLTARRSCILHASLIFSVTHAVTLWPWESIRGVHPHKRSALVACCAALHR